MEASAGLVAGSHKKNQLVVIKQDVEKAKPLQHESGQVCHICGDDIGPSETGDLFVACIECAFPVCRPCYEYERKDGNKVCPQCKTIYKRHKGSPRVEGDEEEDDVDDLENEFDYMDMEKHNKQRIAEAMMQEQMQYEGADDRSINRPMQPTSHVSGEFPAVSPEHHSMDMPERNGKQVHSAQYADYNIPSSVESRSMDMDREFSPYEFGNIAWKDRLESWRVKQEKMQITTTEGGQAGSKGNDSDDQYGAATRMMDEAKLPLSRTATIPPSRINPYRFIIIVRLLILAFFLKFRIENPVEDAYGLWLTSVICEIWFALSWILDQFPKWSPLNRETYLHRLSLRFEPEGLPSMLAAVDVYVSTVDPMKEPPLVTANTVLSILSVDYPVDKVSCYVSDDGAAMLTFETLSETSEFARKWVPFCKKFNVEPRAPEVYFAQKIDYLKDKVEPSYVKERRAMKREYEEFKIRINALVAKAQKVPEDGWIMQDGTPWPGNNTRDHPGMIQVFLGHSGGYDTEGNEIPKLVYVSREKRPGFTHHKKAGAMNALVRVSAVLTNAPFFLNLDCDHYINSSKALREAMCFLMDPVVGKNVCYVQFPQRFDGIDRHDRYANRNIVFFDINLKGLDGVQGPVYVGTGCVFRRQALYGVEAPMVEDVTKEQNFIVKCCCGPPRKKKNAHKKKLSKDKPLARSESSLPMFNPEEVEEGIEGYRDDRTLLISQRTLEKRFGQSPVFIASTLNVEGGIPESANSPSLLKEAIHVISCGYEGKTEWGKELGWIYGSVTEDILTGFKMHSRGWRSIYYMPPRPAFKGSAPINLSDRLHQVLRWALGSIEILLSRHSPIWYGYGGRLKWLQRFAYINTTIYPLTSLPLIAYCCLPAICLLTDKFIIPPISNFASLWFISLFISIFTTAILEMRWSGVGLEDWWRNEQFWVIGGVSAHLFAVFQGLLKVLAGIDTNFTVTSKANDDVDFGELYMFKWTTLLIPPMTILIINFIGIVAGISDALNSGYQSWGPLFGKLFFAFWVIVHLYPFLKGLMGRQNRTPTIVIVWSILLASIFSLLWVKIDPFMSQTTDTTSTQPCGVSC